VTAAELGVFFLVENRADKLEMFVLITVHFANQSCPLLYVALFFQHFNLIRREWVRLIVLSPTLVVAVENLVPKRSKCAFFPKHVSELCQECHKPVHLVL